MNWPLWSKQVDAIAWLEFKRFWLSRRATGVYLVALAPNMLMLPLFFRPGRGGMLETTYAAFFELFWLRLVIFFACASVFSQFFRGEILQKTLHYYFLAPVRREIVVVGKYLAALAGMAFVFSAATVLSYLLFWGRTQRGRNFVVYGGGIQALGKYVVIVVLACAIYGALFLLMGLLFKNPMLPAMFVLTWESFSHFLPEQFQRISVIHYMRPLLPVVLPRGPFAIVAEPTTLWLGIPGLVVFAAILLAFAAFILRHTQITYTTD